MVGLLSYAWFGGVEQGVVGVGLPSEGQLGTLGSGTVGIQGALHSLVCVEGVVGKRLGATDERLGTASQ